MTPQNIEVVNLTRGTAEEDGPWVSGGGHRVHAPWSMAECEVKARVLRSFAARSTPPDGVAFMREWETPEIPHLAKLSDPATTAVEAGALLVQNVGTPAQMQTECLPCGGDVRGDAQAKPRGRRGR